MENTASSRNAQKIAAFKSIHTDFKEILARKVPHMFMLWGNDIEGHLPGDALINLFDNGFDQTKRIIGAHGARPVLKNLTESEVNHFRKQIQIIDLCYINREEAYFAAGPCCLLGPRACQSRAVASSGFEIHSGPGAG